MIFEISAQALAVLVPLVWGGCALYLIWGTERSAPLGYPILMGAVASLSWLSLNEMPAWFPSTVTAEAVTSALLVTAVVLAFEVAGHTIRRNKLGHRSELMTRLLGYLAARFASAVRADAIDGIPEPETHDEETHDEESDE